jgi:hypothetical protein
MIEAQSENSTGPYKHCSNISAHPIVTIFRINEVEDGNWPICTSC